MAMRSRSQRAQESRQSLLISKAQLIEVVDHAVCLRALTGMLPDRDADIGGATVMQEEQALADTPQRRSTELPAVGKALGDAILESRAHVMQGEVAVRLDRLIAHTGNSGLSSGGLISDMAGVTADIREHLLSAGH